MGEEERPKPLEGHPNVQSLSKARRQGVIETVIDASLMVIEISRAVRPIIQLASRLGSQAAKIPARMEQRLKVLARKGWFIDAEMPLAALWKLEEAFRTGREDYAELWLIAYYRREGRAICDRLCAEHPARAELIQCAFRAHVEAQYALSVPVFLQQADGLAHDLGPRRQLFSKTLRHGVRGLMDELNSTSDPSGLKRAFLSVYADETSLIMATDDLPEDFDGLNRHAVLHGTSVNYATEINSLRALSVLSYASLALRQE